MGGREREREGEREGERGREGRRSSIGGRHRLARHRAPGDRRVPYILRARARVRVLTDSMGPAVAAHGVSVSGQRARQQPSASITLRVCGERETDELCDVVLTVV